MADSLQGEYIIIMKKLIFGLIAIVFISNFSYSQFDGTLTKNVIKFENLFDIPSGSKIIYDKEKNKFDFTLNNDYLISGVDSKGQLKIAAGGTITCKCTKGSGCNPFIANGGSIVGCSVTACTACSMTCSIMIDNSAFELSKVTIIDKSEKIHFITEKEELLSLKCPQSTFLEDKGLENEIVNFIKSYQKNNLKKVKIAKTNEELVAIGYLLSLIHI
jgi:hypothetical protein